jgi:hypothetical protein
VGGLVHTFAVAAIKGFCLNHLINVEINLFTSTSIFNRFMARLPATMVAKTVSIVVGGGQ